MYDTEFVWLEALAAIIVWPLASFACLYGFVLTCSILNHRYGMMWPGVEPEKGKYNQTYLDASMNLITRYSVSLPA